MPLKKNKCLHCGHEWAARVERSKKCPNIKCQSKDWDKPKIAIDIQKGFDELEKQLKNSEDNIKKVKLEL